MKDLLRVEELTVDFGVHEGTLRAVDHVSFAIPPGGTVALVGESGSGKSVCSQAIMGLLPRTATISSGSILFDDPRNRAMPVDIARLDRSGPEMRAIRGGAISIIFQEPMTSLSALHTVGDQIGEAVELHGGGRLSELHRLGDQINEAAQLSGRRMSRPEIEEVTRDMLRMVGFPDPRRALRTYPFELSGGLRQRAMIAMALVCRPALLIADEPTTALDVTIQAQILRLMKDLQAELGMALLMITHDLGVVANVADDVVVMYRGKVVEAGDLHDIFRDPQHPYLKALLHAVPRFDMVPGERLVPIREITAATGHLLKEKAVSKPTASFNPQAPVLKVRHLSKTFTIRKADTLFEQLVGGGTTRTVRAVNDVSFDVERGECLGLVGESGCGKTTLSKILMRGISADPNEGADYGAGRIVYDDWGRKIDVLSLEGAELDRFRTKLQFIFQDPFGSLNPRMTVYDILVEPLVIHKIGDDSYRREMVSELMEMVGLDRRHLSRYPHSFSGGQRQRIGIARALALRPDMVICDEPVSALDVSIQAQILNLLKDLQKQLGLTYMFISHNLAVVDYIADRIAVMCAGRLVELAPAGQLFKNPMHPYTKALLSAVPMPDPDARLDLGALMEGKASDPMAWPEPFRDSGGSGVLWTEVEPGHFVRMRADGQAEGQSIGQANGLGEA